MFWSWILIFVPFIGAAFITQTKSLSKQAWLGISVGAITLTASIVGFLQVREAGVLFWETASLGIFQPALRVDSLSSLFSLFSAFVWFATGIYMYTYMQHEERVSSFYIFYLITLGATQGIFLAGNFITLLVFFEIMTVTSFFWVIHRQDQEAVRAGYFYLFLGIAAGLFIVGAIVLLQAAGISLEIGVAAGVPTNSTMFAWAVLLLIFGFGIKAGMIPLHIWLPMAHPVAPTPGSALLSGILIKSGAYGLIRTGQLLNWGQGDLLPWVGTLVVILGVFTMLLGVSLALLQGNAKRLLAYHSVSQMGYIILGIGTALVLKAEGAYGVSGAIFHSLNHALFKSALFLGVGIIFLGTGELDLYKLGGLWKRYPFTGVMMLIAAMGITGTPGLNGYISKSLLHHSVSEVALSQHPIMVWAERLFLLVGVGTTASFVKLIGLTFLGEQKSTVAEDAKEGPFLATAMFLLALVMLIIGTQPHLVLNLFVTPATVSAGMVEVEHLAQLRFFESVAVWDMIITLAVGFIFFIIGMKTNLFHYEPPAWLSVEALGCGIVCCYRFVAERVSTFYTTISKTLTTRYRRRYKQLMVINRRLDWEGGGIFTILNFSNLNSNAFLLLTVLTALVLYYLGLQLMGAF